MRVVGLSLFVTHTPVGDVLETGQNVLDGFVRIAMFQRIVKGQLVLS